MFSKLIKAAIISFAVSLATIPAAHSGAYVMGAQIALSDGDEVGDLERATPFKAGPEGRSVIGLTSPESDSFLDAQLKLSDGS